jgi:hypothetical protein
MMRGEAQLAGCKGSVQAFDGAVAEVVAVGWELGGTWEVVERFGEMVRHTDLLQEVIDTCSVQAATGTGSVVLKIAAELATVDVEKPHPDKSSMGQELAGLAVIASPLVMLIVQALKLQGHCLSMVQ